MIVGTYRLSATDIHRVIPHAVHLGLVQFDTARLYRNEEALGEALSPWNPPHVFVTSKVIKQDIVSQRVLSAVDESYRLLRGNLHCMLLHCPTDNAVSAWATLTHDVTPDRVSHVGVSNFPLELMEQLDPLPFVHQVELSPFCPRRRMLAWCEQNGVQVTAHSPFGKGQLLEQPLVQERAQTLGCTASQLLLSWAAASNATPIPRTSQCRHLDEWVQKSVDLPLPWQTSWVRDPQHHLVTHPQYPSEPEP